MEIAIIYLNKYFLKYHISGELLLNLVIFLILFQPINNITLNNHFIKVMYKQKLVQTYCEEQSNILKQYPKVS